MLVCPLVSFVFLKPFTLEFLNLKCLSVHWSLRKHDYSNISKSSPPKTEIFQIKNSDIFHISAQNIECGYSQSMFSSKNKKNNVYPCKPQFYYIKVGFKGVKIIQACFRDVSFVFVKPFTLEFLEWTLSSLNFEKPIDKNRSLNKRPTGHGSLT